jgi:plasmid stabilization system protein ParE
VRIAYSPRAVTDLAEIGDYLAERNPNAAAAVEQLALFPASGRMLEERTAVRVIPLGNFPYRIFYTTSRDEMIILHIRHGAPAPIDPSEL